MENKMRGEKFMENKMRGEKFMENKIKRIQIGMIIAGLASFSTFLALVFSKYEISILFTELTIGGAIAAYVVGGGIKYALKCIVGCAKVFYTICPFLFTDIMFAMVGFVIGLGIFFALPIIFVAKNYLDVKAAMNENNPFVYE